MHDTATLILAIIGSVITWTGSVIALVLWLVGKFRHLEKAIYKESQKHKTSLTNLTTRVQRLEIKLFGFTPVTFDLPHETDPAES